MKALKAHTALGVILAVTVLGCGDQSGNGPAAPSTELRTADPPSAGLSSGLAVGDTGGPLQIFNVTVRPAGAPQFYAAPGGVYRVEPGVLTEFWVEWRSTQASATVPRLIIEWGFAESDNIHCGPCLLRKTFPLGLHDVRVKLDDRAGGVTVRTFQIDTRPQEPNGDGTHALFANGPGYSCPTGATTFRFAAPLDPSSSAQAKAACEACYGTCYLESADCAGLGWGPRPQGAYECGEAYFGFQSGCSGDSGRSWRICNSYTTFGYWGRY